MKKEDFLLNTKAEVVMSADCNNISDLIIAAHHDDIEIMCPHIVTKSMNNSIHGAACVILTNGEGSQRVGAFANYSNKDMIKVRRREQIKAVHMYKAKVLFLLNYKSSEIKDKEFKNPVLDIKDIILKLSPATVHIHNIFDKHPTHVGSAVKCIEAIRELPFKERPQKLYGCEVWRGLDWMSDKDKIINDMTGSTAQIKNIVAVFRSQIEGGKKYDRALLGRLFANATFSDSHQLDKFDAASYAVDLTPLIEDDSISIREFAEKKIEEFKQEIVSFL